MTEHQRSSVSRRSLLAGVGAGLALATAGCTGDEGASITPVPLDGERACDECGMIIEDHPGPVGQIHFEDNEPEGGRPGQFCSSTCTYTYRFDAEAEGRTTLATFLTDYSTVDYEVFTEGSDTMFSSHVKSEAFERLPNLTVVARSEVIGAMGPGLIPFSEKDDLESFVEEYGGESMPAEDVERSTLEAL
ncbi:nitrous oxide reductase accessory protein NosL [Halorubrum sp. BOL3-1]|uniref:nitrous oxide reductase accessory protein NosL n=1 Tax=Halorubrum sp. BOL3-1 TaxID=2497325 RepID=UPI0010051D0C|nr:nitrous oxide reductase accessory protein NosL [Halorubrum sp. BOL3-1]QAU14141.1 nitrous oxide reductase accessory protein NosL [Halorubrum sp. BOL3-1]